MLSTQCTKKNIDVFATTAQEGELDDEYVGSVWSVRFFKDVARPRQLAFLVMFTAQNLASASQTVSFEYNITASTATAAHMIEVYRDAGVSPSPGPDGFDQAPLQAAVLQVIATQFGLNSVDVTGTIGGHHAGGSLLAVVRFSLTFHDFQTYTTAIATPSTGGYRMTDFTTANPYVFQYLTRNFPTSGGAETDSGLLPDVGTGQVVTGFDVGAVLSQSDFISTTVANPTDLLDEWGVSGAPRVYTTGGVTYTQKRPNAAVTQVIKTAFNFAHVSDMTLNLSRDSDQLDQLVVMISGTYYDAPQINAANLGRFFTAGDAGHAEFNPTGASLQSGSLASDYNAPVPEAYQTLVRSFPTVSISPQTVSVSAVTYAPLVWVQYWGHETDLTRQRSIHSTGGYNVTHTFTREDFEWNPGVVSPSPEDELADTQQAMVTLSASPWIMSCRAQTPHLNLEVGDVVRVGGGGGSNTDYVTVVEKRKVTRLANATGQYLYWRYNVNNVADSVRIEPWRPSTTVDAWSSPQTDPFTVDVVGTTNRDVYAYKLNTALPLTRVDEANWDAQMQATHALAKAMRTALQTAATQAANPPAPAVANPDLDTDLGRLVGSQAFNTVADSDALLMRHKLLSENEPLYPVFKVKNPMGDALKRADALKVPLDRGIKAVHSIKLMAYSLVNKRQIGYQSTHEMFDDDWVALHLKEVSGEFISNHREANGAFTVLHVGHAKNETAGAIEIREQDPAGLVTHTFEQPRTDLRSLTCHFKDRSGHAAHLGRVHLWFKLCVTSG